MKRVFSFLLVLLLVTSLMPVQAMAETTGAHSITVNVEGSGTASANFQTANAGDTVTINWEPESGYELKTITGSSSAGSVEIDPYRYDFTMPDGDVTVTVKFGLIGDGDDSESYVNYMYFEEGVPGVPLGMDGAAAEPGSRYTFVPITGYTIARVDAYDASENPLPVDANHSVVVPAFGGVSAFVWLTQGGGNTGGNDGDSNPQPTEYNITVATPENGTVSGVPAKAKKDDVITVTTTPADGYELDKITVTCNGTEVPVTDGKFTMPEGEVTVTVTFKAIQQNPPAPTEYNITVTTPENGTVSGVPAKAKKDDVITVTATPAEGYELDKITVLCNGTEVTVTDGKFTMPEGEVTVTVTFKAKQTLPSGLTFTYAYDVQRYPVYPKKGDNFRVSGFAKPYGPSGSQLDSNEGPWVLSPVGKYSSNKNLSRNLTSIVNGIAGEYGVPADDLPIHKLIRCNNGQETTIAYGVLVMHNSSKQVAFFIGDSLSGSGAGYFFSKEVQSGTQNYDVPKDVTDEVKPSAEHTTDPNSNAFKANIDLTDKAVVDMLVTQEDLASGQKVRVYMEVKEMTTSTVPSGDKTAINGKANGRNIAAFLDIQLWKQIDNNNATPIRNTGNKSVPITMKLTNAVIPSGAGKDSFSIIYHHVENGTTVTEEIPATFDVSSKTLTFNASKFSTYALVVKSAGTLDKAVKAGDIAGINDMTMLLLCCAFVLAGVAVYDKKRAR